MSEAIGVAPADESADDDNREHLNRRYKPALTALLHDQRALVDASYEDGVTHDLRRGFPDRRHLIEWYQRAVVRSLGNIASTEASGTELPPSALGHDTVLLRATLEDGPRDAGPLGEAAAEDYRSILEVEFLQPACNRAYRDLRVGAGEYIDVDTDPDETYGPDDLDPAEQKHVAMRPGFQVLDDTQAATLSALWGGFEDKAALRDWLHDLNRPTNGEISPTLARETVTDTVAVRAMVHERDSDWAREYRELFAISELLPAFAAGVQSVDAGELAARKRQGTRTLSMSGGSPQ